MGSAPGRAIRRVFTRPPRPIAESSVRQDAVVPLWSRAEGSHDRCGKGRGALAVRMFVRVKRAWLEHVKVALGRSMAFGANGRQCVVLSAFSRRATVISAPTRWRVVVDASADPGNA